MKPKLFARPLLAVATAASLCACSSATVSSEPAPTVAPVATPRVMASGRPACGNVASRAPRPPDCEDR